jgi:aminopeptidase-like protein/aminoglycoside N3'-acetyltransferase
MDGEVTTVNGADIRTELRRALDEVGVTRGDTVMLHLNLAALGMGDAAAEPRDDAYRAVSDAVRDAIGAEGTLVVPTYTFSFCRREEFDVDRTPTAGGPWSPTAGFLEYVRAIPGALRSRDPIHSVVAVGARAAELVDDVPPTCFGEGSVFERLVDAGAKVCVLGLPLEEATIRHHFEESFGVPFRYRKLFTGRIIEGGKPRKSGWVYSVRILADNGYPDGSRLEALAREKGVCRAAAVGKGELLLVDAREYRDLTLCALADDPWLTARGPAGDPVALEAARVGTCRPQVTLPRDASMREMVDGLWHLHRHIVSDGYDAALDALAGQLPMTIHEYPSGTEAWSWIVPEKWTCHEAYLETLDGRRLFSHDDHPLHVVSYSLPFEGEVSRETLLEHLHVHPMIPQAVPFIFKYYERDWGLCCSRELRDSLSDDRYRVVIRTSSSYGTLKVGEVVAPGASDECIVLCAHLCHPAMVNDDLSGVVVGMDVMRALLARRDLHYTYRFIILPETIGSLAWLSGHEELIPKMRGGLFLEMLGRDFPHALQHSFEGDTEVDRAFAKALKEADPRAWTARFRELAGNDERQFNAPGVRVPMLSLTRVVRTAEPNAYYREYHSSHDTPELVPPGSLEESRDVVLGMIEELERSVSNMDPRLRGDDDTRPSSPRTHPSSPRKRGSMSVMDGSTVPVNRHPGEPFCSRFGVNIDAYANPEGYRALFDILYLVDGTRSVAEIAGECGIAVESALGTIEELRRRGVVDA